jgi:hypothetical protein
MPAESTNSNKSGQIRQTVTSDAYRNPWGVHGQLSSTKGGVVYLGPATCRLKRLMLSQMLARADGGYNWGSDISGVYGGGDSSGDWYIAGDGWDVANF